ncbi:MAG TPA: HdeD family acid-resistance protein [Burkholderiales bacterium]|nr:HdeD family acid-resistance protein [Burkholderiales bacterium]
MAIENVLSERISTVLSRNWWLLLLRGIIAILFGVLTYFQPGISLATLVLLFGAFAFADGVIEVWQAVSARKERENWWVLLLGGLLGIGVGVLTLVHPGVTALALLFYIAIWAVATGVLEIVAAIRLRKEIEGEWLLGLAGVASVLFGVLLIMRPDAGALAVLWLIATYAIVFGVILVLLAFKARGFARRVEERRAA